MKRPTYIIQIHTDKSICEQCSLQICARITLYLVLVFTGFLGAPTSEVVCDRNERFFIIMMDNDVRGWMGPVAARS